MSSYTDQCPLCGRTVRESQKRCACGAVLAQDEAETETYDYGRFLPWVPLTAFVLLVFWVSHLGPLSHPLTKLFKIGGVMVIVSAVLTLLDANRISGRIWMYASSKLAGLSPAAWFGAILLVWPFAFPAFLYVTYKHEDPPRMKLGWGGAGLFAVTFLLLWVHIGYRTPAWTAEAFAPKGSSLRPVSKLPANTPAVVNQAGTDSVDQVSTETTRLAQASVVAGATDVATTSAAEFAPVSTPVGPKNVSPVSPRGSGASNSAAGSAAEARPAMGVDVMR